MFEPEANFNNFFVGKHIWGKLYRSFNVRISLCFFYMFAWCKRSRTWQFSQMLLILEHMRSQKMTLSAILDSRVAWNFFDVMLGLSCHNNPGQLTMVRSVKVVSALIAYPVTVWIVSCSRNYISFSDQHSFQLWLFHICREILSTHVWVNYVLLSVDFVTHYL